MISMQERDALIVAAYVRRKTTLLAVGRKFGISEERVRQIVAKAERSRRTDEKRRQQRTTMIALLKNHFEI